MLDNINFQESYHEETSRWRYLVKFTKDKVDFQANVSFKDKQSKGSIIKDIKHFFKC